LVATSTRQLTLVRRRRFELQEFSKGGGSGLVQGGPQSALDGLQIGVSAVSPLSENAAQQLIHFPRNFLMDCSSRFFS
jgi:hypothetical protein